MAGTNGLNVRTYSVLKETVYMPAQIIQMMTLTQIMAICTPGISLQLNVCCIMIGCILCHDTSYLS